MRRGFMCTSNSAGLMNEYWFANISLLITKVANDLTF